MAKAQIRFYGSPKATQEMNGGDVEKGLHRMIMACIAVYMFHARQLGWPTIQSPSVWVEVEMSVWND